MAANKLNISGDIYENNVFQSKLLSGVLSSSLCSQCTMLLPLSKYLHPTYPVDPTSIHRGLNFGTRVLVNGTAIGFLQCAVLVNEE